MNLYVFLGLLPLAYAFCAFVLFISGFIVKSRGLKIVGGIALAPVVAALLLLVIAVGMGERRSKDPAWVFEQEFLTPPPREVTGLRGHATEMNNGRFAYLRFSAPPEVIDSLISDWMAPASPSDLSRTDHPPIRWAPPTVPPARFYRATHLRKMCDGCGSDEVLCCDPATHVAYFGRF